MSELPHQPRFRSNRSLSGSKYFIIFYLFIYYMNSLEPISQLIHNYDNISISAFISFFINIY